MALPTVQVTGLTAQQADGNVLLAWNQATDANGVTSYNVQRSTDGITFSNLGTGVATANPTYADKLPGVGYLYYYRVAAENGTGVSVNYSLVASVVAAPPSEMSLAELRLQARQTADRVGSNFVKDPEWNQFIRIAMYELYDLLIGSYEDYYAQNQATILTNGSQQYYPLPDGVSMYPGGAYSSATAFTFTVSSANASVNAVYSNNNYAFTVQATISSQTSLSVVGTGPALPYGILTKVSGTGDNQIVFSSVALTNSAKGQPAQAFYKLAGIDLAVNTSTVNPAWVTLKKFNFIDRNKYVYPNSTSTIYGVYNQAYRIMGNQVQFIPVPAGNQTLRLWYAPRLPALLLDTDLTTIGYSGWIRYPIIRAAKYALDKEESDSSKLTEEIAFLKTRIEQMSQNRDQGAADTISETRRDGIYGGNGWGGGGGQAGWVALLFFPSLFEDYIGNTSAINAVLYCQMLLSVLACCIFFSYFSRRTHRYFSRGMPIPFKAISSPLRNFIPHVFKMSSHKQMLWVYTRGIVAFMQNSLAAWKSHICNSHY